MKFGDRWLGWLQLMFDSARISVLINGIPTKEFKPSCGIRQSDPLSPLLFLLVGEILHCMLQKVVNQEIFGDIQYNQNGNC